MKAPSAYPLATPSCAARWGAWLSALLGAWTAGGAQQRSDPPHGRTEGEAASQAANWRRDATGDLSYPAECVPGLRSFGR